MGAAAVQPLPSSGDLIDLARARDTASRERLMLGVAALCDSRPPDGTLSPVLSEIFLTLARQAEREVRKALSERLASADWAPRALVNVLALDEIEIARPILASSPVLTDDDLLAVLVQATLEHQVEVARRPWISGRVADVIIDKGDPAILCALAANTTAEISTAGLRRLVEQSRRVPGLRAPLARHPQLSAALAQQMYLWVGQALREAITRRFDIDPKILAQQIDKAVGDALNPVTTVVEDEPDRDEMDRRLIEKLRAAGQLRSGILIRALRENRLGLFVHGLAVLSDLPITDIRRALSSRSSEPLYYACVIVGVDRAAFTGIRSDIRRLNRGLPGDNAPPDWTQVGLSTESARRAFKTMMDSGTV